MLRITLRRKFLRLSPTHHHVILIVNNNNQLYTSQKRHFFGLGEVLSVISNPAETLRQLNESKELVQKAREESKLAKERSKIPKKHTFSQLPGFHGREAEQALLRKMLAASPQMNVVFGATSVGKTALLRQVLAGDDFFVIKFDLRISGFADLKSLYVSLCEQFQSFFEEMDDEEMDNQGITFKHMLLDMVDKEKEMPDFKVTVADLANLMETLQSCLLKYWEYDPIAKMEADEDGDEKKELKAVKGEAKAEGRMRSVDPNAESGDGVKKEKNAGKKEEHESGKVVGKRKDGRNDEGVAEEEEEKKVFKKRPLVFFMDEAHKLPALVDDTLSLKVFLDTLLVLTKQDRLCHVILATSDSFFQHFLRSMNVGHHSQLMTIGDCPKAETYSYFREELLPIVPKELIAKVDFEEIYEAFGGKLSHINDYLRVWINNEGNMTPLQSTIFTQAYTLLEFHLTHPQFETFSPLTTATAGTNPDASTNFSRDDLIYVMRELIKPPYSLAYFDLCRKVGTAQADAMIKTRILDLRWTKTVSPEQDWVERWWSRDGIERPIVLPMTRIVRRAMEVALMEEDGRAAEEENSG